MRDGDKFRPSTVAIHADALGVRTKMTAAGETIAAMSAGDVALAGDEIAFGESFNVITDAIDHADKLVADGHRHRNGLLRPRIPIIYMYVGSADGSLDDADEDVVALDFWNGNFFEPKPRLGFAFHDGLHRFLHEMKLSADFADSRRFPASGCRN